MKKTKTYFEQVPLSSVKVFGDGNFQHGNIACAICGSPIPLEQCKSDENGSAVHEVCYANKIIKSSQPAKERTARS